MESSQYIFICFQSRNEFLFIFKFCREKNNTVFLRYSLNKLMIVNVALIEHSEIKVLMHMPNYLGSLPPRNSCRIESNVSSIISPFDLDVLIVLLV